jgi:hypothetical protein
LEDENSSLWFLLDEFEKSNIKNPEYQDKFVEIFGKLKKGANDDTHQGRGSIMLQRD